MRKFLLSLLAYAVMEVFCFGQAPVTHTYPAEDTTNVFTGANSFQNLALLNSLYYVGYGGYTSITLANTAACASSIHKGIVVILPGSSSTDTISTATAGCSGVWLEDRTFSGSNPEACYAWGTPTANQYNYISCVLLSGSVGVVLTNPASGFSQTINQSSGTVFNVTGDVNVLEENGNPVLFSSLYSPSCATTTTLSATANKNRVVLSCNITTLTIPAGNSNSSCFALEIVNNGGYTLGWGSIFRTPFAPSLGAGSISSATECWDNTSGFWYLSGIPVVNQ